jgi:hypothetical protein
MKWMQARPGLRVPVGAEEPHDADGKRASSTTGLSLGCGLGSRRTPQ